MNIKDTWDFPFVVNTEKGEYSPNGTLLELLEMNESLFESHEYRQVALHVIHDPRFQRAPASVKYHHNYTHGLLIHTHQVINYSQAWAKAEGLVTLDNQVLFLASLFHDFGKCFDYEEVDDLDPIKQVRRLKWLENKHKKNFDHILRSVLEWESACGHIFSDHFKNHVSHCIYAHHQLREWGSPVRPNSPEAWALHLADMMSGFGWLCPPFQNEHTTVRVKSTSLASQEDPSF